MEITELAEFRYLSKNFADLGFKVVIKSTFHNNFWPLYWPWFQIYTFCIPIQCFFISFERKSWLFRLLYVFWGSSVENSKITESTKFRYFAPNPENKTIPLFGPSTVLYIVTITKKVDILLPGADSPVADHPKLSHGIEDTGYATREWSELTRH